MSHKRFCL